jgi:hypothetical protein
MGYDKLMLSLLTDEYAVCKFEPEHDIPEWVTNDAFWSVTKTRNELSIVCPGSQVPEDVKAESGWRILEVEGPLDFSMTGVLNRLTRPLADSKISVFVLSTYLTDYLLIHSEDLKPAIEVLQAQGHKISHEI